MTSEAIHHPASTPAVDLTRSLSYASDLMFHRHAGEVGEHDGFLSIRTPDNPGFWWGNFLLFGQPPGAGERISWERLFETHIDADPGGHRVFGWIGEEGETADFIAQGYTLCVCTALASQRPLPPARGNGLIEVRSYQSEADWQAAVELQVQCRDAGMAEDAYRPFKQAQFAFYRRLEEKALGRRYGAFVEGKLVADLGIYPFGTAGRYNNVCTHPDHRRQGIAAQLIFEAGWRAMSAMTLQTLVIVTDEDSTQRLYKSVGFIPHDVSYGLQRQPR
ncbi:GNAT family N-acetyltransferase [Chitinimonas arctica]|uniref:GNAT family N-acetyltransferase n=1 Tax=Chitinimonas arctica TaxID=2594795 RepID=A0A516SFR9_9NEIS|nr:GNAT family N-acetyltransferase [Chitinimonas arctica]QDQ27015.1 GNAT family N-acetyltransferase [Chitinimonas arctica]